MSGWLCYIDSLAFWYVYFFEEGQGLKLTCYPIVIEQAVKLSFDKQGEEVNFNLYSVGGDTFAKIEL
jgi:ATP-dependent protease ClpP protease subunit